MSISSILYQIFKEPNKTTVLGRTDLGATAYSSIEECPLIDFSRKFLGNGSM